MYFCLKIVADKGFSRKKRPADKELCLEKVADNGFWFGNSGG